jgi:hypothetical protein
MLASNPVRDNLIVTEYFDKGFQIWLPLYFIPELDALKNAFDFNPLHQLHIQSGCSTHTLSGSAGAWLF